MERKFKVLWFISFIILLIVGFFFNPLCLQKQRDFNEGETYLTKDNKTILFFSEKKDLLIHLSSALNDSIRSDLINILEDGTLGWMYYPMDAGYSFKTSSFTIRTTKEQIKKLEELDYVVGFDEKVPILKLSRGVWNIINSNEYSYSKNWDGTYELKIIFYKDVQYNEAKKVIDGICGKIENKEYFDKYKYLMANIKKSKIEELIKYSEIHLVEPKPSPKGINL